MIDSTVDGERNMIYNNKFVVPSSAVAQKEKHGKELEQLLDRLTPPVAPKEKRMLSDYCRIYYKKKEGMQGFMKSPSVIREVSHECAYACMEHCIDMYNKGDYL